MPTDVIIKVKSTLIEVLNLKKETNISDQSKLKDDLGLDSMSSLTFLMKLEENIDGFVVDPETLEMSDLETISSIAQYVLSQLNEEGESKSSAFEREDLSEVVYA